MIDCSVVQSLEFLEKSRNLQTSFPDLEKVWKIKIKSGKMVKSLVLKTETSALLLSDFFQVVKPHLKFRLWRKHSIALPRSLRSLLCQHCIVVTVYS